MKSYDPTKPIISLHVPKCAGQSFRAVLEKWFGERFFIHYFQQYNALPRKHPLQPGICIHGHFNHTKGFGVENYYSEVDQYLTVLRDPLESAISNYFFWKRKARIVQLNRKLAGVGAISDGEQSYLNIDDFFRKRPKSTMLSFLPKQINAENYKEFFESKFVWIGLASSLQPDVDNLSRKLGFPQIMIERLNVSTRDEYLSNSIQEDFIANNSLEFEMYAYVRDKVVNVGICK